MRDQKQKGLQRAAVLSLHTDEGARDIELWFGDITQLSPDEKVDTIMVSAFPGDYSPTPTSVIGALKRNLDISVRDLYNYKAVDNRKHFCCWVSKELPGHLPYRRLLCFERVMRHMGHPAEMVREVFRALIPCFNNEEFSVITPLLASGDQNFSKLMMLEAIVDAAAFWQSSGLPMACLKIVIYTPDPTKLSDENQRLLALFKLFQNKWEKRQAKAKVVREIQYDVYLSFSSADKERMTDVVNLLKKEKPDLKVFAQAIKPALEIGDDWQQSTRDAIVSSARFIPLLTPNYMESPFCLEQYNLAMCTGMKERREIIAPFYVETVDLPTYMCMVQYIDCRGHKEGKMKHALKTFVDTLQKGVLPAKPRAQKAAKYDVFISYAHRNTSSANQIVDCIHLVNPAVKIFIDRESLHTGALWQQTLYNALDNSRVIVVLWNDDYAHSPVCLEELAVATSLHVKMGASQELLPVVTGGGQLPSYLDPIRFIDARGNQRAAFLTIAKALDALVQFDAKLDRIFMPHLEKPVSGIEVMKSYRERIYRTELQRHVAVFKTLRKRASEDNLNYLRRRVDHLSADVTPDGQSPDDVIGSQEIRPRLNSLDPGKPGKRRKSWDAANGQVVNDIVISTHSKTVKYATFLQLIFKSRAPHLKVSVLALGAGEEGEGGTDLGLLDTGRVILLLLSRSYCTDPQSLEALHVSLCRERGSGTLVYPILVSWLPETPTYLQLLPARLATPDAIWHTVLQETLNNQLPLHVQDATLELVGGLASLNDTQSLALATGAEDIILKLRSSPDTSSESQPVLLNMLSVMEDMKIDLAPIRNELKSVPAPSFDLDFRPETPDESEDPELFQAKTVADYKAAIEEDQTEAHMPPATDVEDTPSHMPSSPQKKGTNEPAQKTEKEGTKKAKSCTIL